MIRHAATAGSPVERRRFPRHPVAVPCRLAMCAGLHWTENLSVGGALVVPAGPAAPSSRIELGLHFTWCEPIWAKARVVYHREAELPEYPAMGLRFLHTQRGSRALMRRALAAMPVALGTAAVAPVALIMAEPTPLRRALEADIGELGIRAVSTDTPLGTIWRLIAGTVRVSSVLVELASLHDRSLELFRFLEDEFPTVTRVIVYVPPLPAQAKNLLAEQHVHAVLPVPWTRRMLAELMRIKPKRR